MALNSPIITGPDINSLFFIATKPNHTFLTDDHNYITGRWVESSLELDMKNQ